MFDYAAIYLSSFIPDGLNALLSECQLIHVEVYHVIRCR